MTDSKLFANKNYDAMLELLRTLCTIPSPSHHEEKRAQFCKDFLLGTGAENVYIDSAKNVIYEINCDGKNDITVFVAHTDTVFPDTKPFTMIEDDEKIYCPGVGDDTASVAVLLFLAKYFTENNIKPENGVMFVMNSCEEGLGNLHGTRTLMENYKSRIGMFISFDAPLGSLYNRCVGSHRYKVEVLTEGGHSFGRFGNKNAIAELSKIISEIYDIEVPAVPGATTTYNVGLISGGTSINTIAQSAEIFCEYRSDNKDCLAVMKEKFENIFSAAANDKVKVDVTLIGERPCSGEVNEKLRGELVNKCANVSQRILGCPITFKSASTDCNIPMSLGIPSVCIGVFKGNGAHTKEEYVIKDSLRTGLEIALDTAKSILEI